MKFKYILFDLDGTITESGPGIMNSVAYALEKMGYEEKDREKLKRFIGPPLTDSMMKYYGMSEEAARNWFNGTETVETSIAQLVSEIKDYVDKKPDNFRLLFMIDEVGQYVGENTDHLLNLQSLIEEIGSKCEGKV